ncbi:MAG: hypothetical protein ACOX9B_06895 [Candidatus Xenobium sp.]|nr:hypothetical protein [Burkholderiales bacterium]
MYCPHCDENFSSFHSLCPNCFAELRSETATGPPSSPVRDRGLTEPHPGLDLATSMTPQIPTVEFPDLTGAVLDKSREVMQQVTEKAATRASEAASRLTMPVIPLEPDLRPPVEPRDQAAGREIQAVLDQSREAAQQVAEKTITRVSKAASRLTTPVTPHPDPDLRPPVEPLDQAALQEIQAALEEAAQELQKLAGRGRESVMEMLHSEGEDPRQAAAVFLSAYRRFLGKEMAPHLDRIRKRYNSIARRLDPGTREAISQRIQFLSKQTSGSLADLENQIKRLPKPVRGVARQLKDVDLPEAPRVDLGSTGEQSVEGVKNSCMGLVGVFLSFLLPGLGHFLIGSAGAGSVLLFIGIVLKVAFPEATVLNWSLSFLAAWHVWMLTRN